MSIPAHWKLSNFWIRYIFGACENESKKASELDMVKIPFQKFFSNIILISSPPMIKEAVPKEKQMIISTRELYAIQ